MRSCWKNIIMRCKRGIFSKSFLRAIVFKKCNLFFVKKYICYIFIYILIHILIN